MNTDVTVQQDCAARRAPEPPLLYHLHKGGEQEWKESTERVTRAMAGARGAGARGGKGNGKKRARAAAAADAPGAEEEHARAARRAKVRGTDPISHTPTRLRVVEAPTGRSACAQNTPLRLT